ncbi:MAG: acyl-CoA thioesterase [Capnocytophaga sp.]|nr:acyl-CoA thioesterase [Capnocytophaga sp.]
MTRKKEPSDEIREWDITAEFRVRFNETDPLGIVWHGHYIAYFEEGREAFGRAHGISYLDINAHGYTTPIVKSVCEHRAPLTFGNLAKITTTFVHTAAAKMIFRYKIFTPDGKLACFGETTQVFVDAKGDLALYKPDFYEKWLRKMTEKHNSLEKK